MIKINETGVLSGAVPRAYVNKITISPGVSANYRNGSSVVKRRTKAANTKETNARPTSINLQVYIQDVVNMQTGRCTWLLSSILRSQLVVRAVQSTNSRLTQQLKDQDVNLSILENYNLHEDYEIKESSLAMDSSLSSPTYSNNISGVKKVFSLVKNLSFDLSFEPEHLTYFVFSESRSPNDLDAKRGGSDRSPASVERVIRDSKVVKTAAIYRDSSNRIWSGGVHKHPDRGWMEGYVHTPEPHGNLVREVVNNSKIIDMRIIEEVKSLKINISPVSPEKTNKGKQMVSDLYLARNARGYVAGTFAVDYLSFLMNSSKFGNLLRTSPQRVQDEILSLSKILSFKIVRNRVNLSRGLNKLNSKSLTTRPLVLDTSRQVIIQSADQSSKLLSQERYSPGNGRLNKFKQVGDGENPPSNYNFFGSVEELRAYNMGNKRTFVFSDALLNTNTGKYKYTLECTVKDGTYEFMNDRIHDIQECLRGVRGYLYNARMPENYNSMSDTFTQDFISMQMDPNKYVIPTPSELPRLLTALNADAAGKSIQPWLAAIVKYVETMDLLTEMTDGQRSDLSRALYSLLSPVSSTPANIEKFIFVLEDLEKKILKLTTRKITHLRDKSDAYRSDRSSENLEMSIEFDEVFDASSLRDTGFHYFGSSVETNKMLNIRKNDFLDDIQTQLGYLAISPPDQSTLKNQLKTVSDKATNAFLSDSQDMAYMAPSSIQFPNNKINLWSGDSLDYTSITAVIQNMAKISTDELMNVKPTQNILKVLNTVGKGTESTRIKEINNIYVDNAIDNGILLENNVPSNKAPASTKNAEPYFGKSNKFTSAAPEDEDLTTPTTGYNPEMALAVINSVLSAKNTTMKDNLAHSPAKNISFDLSKENNFVTSQLAGSANFKNPQEAQNVLADKITALPSQVKKLAMRQDRFYSDTAASLSSNEDSKTDGFMYNFGMLRAVEYLAGYTDNDMKNPVWVKVNPVFLDQLKSNAVCRIRKIVMPDINIGVYDLLDKVPIYNEYFILRGPSPRKPNMRKVQTKIVASGDNPGFAKDSLLKSAEKGTFVNLIKYEVQQKITQFSNEYIITEPPIAARGTRKSGNTASGTATPSKGTITPQRIPGSGGSQPSARTTSQPTAQPSARTATSQPMVQPMTTTGGGYGGGSGGY